MVCTVNGSIDKYDNIEFRKKLYYAKWYMYIVTPLSIKKCLISYFLLSISHCYIFISFLEVNEHVDISYCICKLYT